MFGALISLASVLRITAVVADYHGLDASMLCLVEKMIGKILEVCPPHVFTNGWKPLWIQERT
jgi:hypothetical protein